MYREKANRALVMVFVLFLAATAARWLHREAIWSQALFRMTEAALVGGIADWFAVTALFQRPLGISFHTALIPRNRKKIIHAITYMVEEELLSRQSILHHLQKIRMVPLVISWIEHGGKKTVFQLVSKVSEGWLQNTDRAQIVTVLAKTIRSRLQATKLHIHVSGMRQWLIQSGKAHHLFDLILAEARKSAARPMLRQEIYRILDKAAREATGEGALGRIFGAFLRTFDFVNLDEAADALHHHLQSELKQLEQPEHPLRIWLIDRMLLSLHELEHNNEWQESVEAWKSGLIDRLPLELFLQPLVDGLLPPADVQSESCPLVAALSRFAATYWDAFRQDLALQTWLERHLQDAAAEVALSEHKLIGELVTQALGTLSDTELSAFIEDKVGEDLAWIRINGSVVGALAGLTVFFLGQFVYLPYIWPWLAGR